MSTTAYQSSCGTFTYGETEDFTVVIVSAPAVQADAYLSQQVQSLKIYPNPACDELNVKFDNPGEDQTAEIRIFDLNGKAVYGSRFNAFSGMNDHKLNVGALGAGQYFVQVVTREFSVTRTVIISR
jgi:hypothetical protein